MSYSIHPSLICDICGIRIESNSEWNPNDAGSTVTTGMIRHLRKQAAESGWKRKKNLKAKGYDPKWIDVCDKCSQLENTKGATCQNLQKTNDP